MNQNPAMPRPVPVEAWRTPVAPDGVPGLLSFWDFQGPESLTARGSEKSRLRSGAGNLTFVEDPKAPFGPKAARFEEGTWLSVPRKDCPSLNRSGPAGALTVLAWIKRWKRTQPGCEFIAGQWNETHEGRQYGLFLNIGTWGGRDQICGHVSNTGGPTPGYKYCMDGALGATAVGWDAWHAVAMSYDGHQAMVWLDGLLDLQAGLNPYPYSGGLHDGGPLGSDFTVGAVHRSGEMGNYFTGLLGGLAVFGRALSPAEIYGLSRPVRMAD